MKPKEPKRAEWIKRFDEGGYGCCGGDFCDGDHTGELKSFIQKELDKARQNERLKMIGHEREAVLEERERVITMVIDRIEMWADDGVIRTTDDIVQRLSQLSKEK